MPARLPLLLALFGLVGCGGGPTYHRCSLGDTLVSDPDGVADTDLLDDLARVLAQFDAWTGNRSVCVEEVVVVETIEVDWDEDGSVAGYWTGEAQRIVVETTASYSPVYILTHELCHALDAETDLSIELEPLLGDVFPPPNPDTYTSEASRRRERFARACGEGPPPEALVEALAESCGEGSSLQQALLDEVWVAWHEEPLALDGPDITFAPVAATAGALDFGAFVGGRTRLFGIGDGGPPELSNDRWHTAFAWDPDAATPDALAFAGRLGLYPGIGGAPPHLTAEADDGTTTVLALYDHHARDADAAWIADVTVTRTDLTVGPDLAWWQTWGDGEPLQVRDLATGAVGPQPGDDDLTLHPPRTLVDGVPWAIGWPEEPAPSYVFALGSAGLAPIAGAPRGLSGVRALPDGRVVGWALAMTDDSYFTSLVVNDGGEWRYSPGSCDPERYFESLEVVDGAVYAAGGRVGLERVAVGE